jgi:predicted alpha-1,6-mannanase (GH76 family)
MKKATSVERGEQSTTWEDALMDAINDIDMIGGELSWRVSDLYTRQGITGRQRRTLICIAKRAQKVLDDLAALRESMGVPKRPGDDTHD